MLKGAIIGFGRVAEKAHVPAWKGSPLFSIVAVADESPERLGVAAQYFPEIRKYASLEALLHAEHSLDFIDIATPPFLHAHQAVLSLQHRCHVLCEKPLALTLQDCESLRAQAYAQNRVVFSVHNWKYAPLFLQAARLIDSGAIGTVTYAELHTLRERPAQNAGEGNWRTDRLVAGGGILVDHGWHNFYLLQKLVQAEPKAVSARLVIPRFEAVEEEAACTIEYPQCFAVLYLSWRAPHRSNWGILYGTTGTLEMRDDLILLTRKGVPQQKFAFSQKLSQGSAHPDWFKSTIEDFHAEITTPKIRYQNLREAENCVTLLTYINQSHRLGGKTLVLPAYPAPPSSHETHSAASGTHRS